jgi:hypothetical protein
MRLLLLLSALLSALSGVVGTRALGQPVQASAAIAAAAPRAVVAASVAARFAAPTYNLLPPLQLTLPQLSEMGTSYPLYAERRRE